MCVSVVTAPTDSGAASPSEESLAIQDLFKEPPLVYSRVRKVAKWVLCHVTRLRAVSARKGRPRLVLLCPSVFWGAQGGDVDGEFPAADHQRHRRNGV